MPVFLIGHGNWYPSDGFTTVPAGTSITFYTQNAKLLHKSVALKIVDGTTTFEPDGTHGPFRTIPNMTLSFFSDEDNQEFRDRAKKRDGGYTLFFAPKGGKVKLSELFQRSEFIGKELIWLACRSLDLKLPAFKYVSPTEKVKTTQAEQWKGRTLGVNARENETSYYFYYTYKTVDKKEFR
jgi:hypothetical protein